MKALQILEPGRAEIVETARPNPGPGEVLIQVEAVNTCPQWDLHIMGGDEMLPGRPVSYPYPPGQPGHEAIGMVVDVGSGVRHLEVGTRVALWSTLDQEILGCYAQYVARDQAELIPVPSDLPSEALASLELAAAVQMSFEALRNQNAIVGRRVGISGLGGAGLIAIQMARAEGADEVIGYDLSSSRRELAKKLGADQCYDPREVDTPDDRSAAGPIDAAIDCAGSAASVQFLMDRTRLAVSLFGVLRDEVRFGWRHWLGLALLGNKTYHRGAAEAALAHIISGQLDLSTLVTQTMPLSDYERGVKMLREQQAIKICFRP